MPRPAKKQKISHEEPPKQTELPNLKVVTYRSRRRTLELFNANSKYAIPEETNPKKSRISQKISDEYSQVKDLPPPKGSMSNKQGKAPLKKKASKIFSENLQKQDEMDSDDISSKQLSLLPADSKFHPFQPRDESKSLLLPGQVPITYDKPEWHAPWKLMRVIAGHLGWVRAVAVDPSNEWFATGAGDRTIKIWDLASGELKLTLTGHISCIRALCISERHPYLFSAGEDKMVKCWDLEYNRAIRHYHGHLSGVYCAALHPTIDLLITGGRDSTARVWDIRTKAAVHTLGSHTNTVVAIGAQAPDPQIVTSSMDTTVRLWDLAAGKSVTTLTHHKKAPRALVIHPQEFTFATGAADNIKQWKYPNGDFLQNFTGQKTIVNTLALNGDNVLFSGGDNGSMHFWDWKTGYNFQTTETQVQPGSLEGEKGIYASVFDKTGSRLITCEGDKSIKIWKEDDEATPETHKISNWRRKKERY